MDVRDLRRQYHALVDEAEALANKADATADEITRCDQILAQADALKARIGAIERVGDHKAEQRQAPKPPLETGREIRSKSGPFPEFGEFLHAVRVAAVEPRSADPRLYESRATGASEGVPSDGGFLVQTDFVDQILERVYSGGAIASRCRPLPVSAVSNGIAIPKIDESSRADGSRWGGLRGYWTGEGGTITASRPKYGKFRLDLDKISVLSYCTDEMLADVPFLGGMLARLVPQEIRFKLENGIVNGSGAGMPLGILVADCTVSQAKETGQAAATLVAENIIKMYSRMWAPSLANAVWLVDQSVFPQLFTMSISVGTGGIPVYMPANGLASAPYGLLFGRPVVPVEHCAALGTVGDILLVDLNEYLLIDKGGVQAAASMHVQFVTDEMAYRWTYRVNGAPWWTSALTPKSGGSTQSCFVSLATRS